MNTFIVMLYTDIEFGNCFEIKAKNKHEVIRYMKTMYKSFCVIPKGCIKKYTLTKVEVDENLSSWLVQGDKDE